MIEQRIMLQNKKVGEKTNFGWLAAVCLMHIDLKQLTLCDKTMQTLDSQQCKDLAL